MHSSYRRFLSSETTDDPASRTYQKHADGQANCPIDSHDQMVHLFGFHSITFANSISNQDRARLRESNLNHPGHVRDTVHTGLSSDGFRRQITGHQSQDF